MYINPAAAASLLATAPGPAFGIATDTIAARRRHSKTGLSKNATTTALSTPAATTAAAADAAAAAVEAHTIVRDWLTTNGRRETTDKKGYDE